MRAPSVIQRTATANRYTLCRPPGVYLHKCSRISYSMFTYTFQIVGKRWEFRPFHNYIRLLEADIEEDTQITNEESRQKPGGAVKAASLGRISHAGATSGKGPETGISPAHINSEGGKGSMHYIYT